MNSTTMSTTTALIIVILAALLAIVALLAVASRRSRGRRLALRSRFGPEYDRAVATYGSPARAERELAARARRADRIRFRELSDADRARFTTEWSAIQARFVDDPARAVREANELIKEVMLALGYPAADFERRTADLSAHHASVVQHYRAAHTLAEANREGRANTEELRQAVVHYRALFAELIEGPALPRERQLRELHA